MNDKLLFRAKSFGMGWQTITWQGWTLIILYIFAMPRYALHTNQHAHSNSDALISITIPFIVLTTLLLIVCYLKGEKPEWHRGEKN